MVEYLTYFYWFFSELDIERTEGSNLTYVNLNIGKKGNRSYRFVPTTTPAAHEFFQFSEEAEELRARKGSMYIARVHVGKYIPNEDLEGDVEPPLNFYETEEVVDYSEKYSKYLIEGVMGKIIKAPLTFKAKITLPGTLHGGQDIVSGRPKSLKTLSMSIMTPEEVETLSVMEVIAFEPRTDTVVRNPVPNGPLDSRLGATDKDARCSTCERDIKNTIQHNTSFCEGHFGHITLPVPVPHLFFVTGSQYPLMDTVLNSVCHSCSRINMPDRTIEYMESELDYLLSNSRRNYKLFTRIGQKRKHLMKSDNEGTIYEFNKDRIRTCRYCGEESPEVKFTIGVVMCDFVLMPSRIAGSQWREDGKSEVYPYEVAYSIIADISDRESKLFGFGERNHPKHMFLEKMPVAPNILRPTVEPYGGGKTENDLTILYSETVRTSNLLRTMIVNDESVHTRERVSSDLFRLVSQCFTNNDKKIGAFATRSTFSKTGSKKANYRGVYDRIKGTKGSKTGRFRNLLLSKSTLNIVRSVVNPDTSLSISEVGIPHQSCFELEIRELVTEENIEWLRALIVRGVEQKDDLRKGPGNFHKHSRDYYKTDMPVAKFVVFQFGHESNMTDRPYYKWNGFTESWCDGFPVGDTKYNTPLSSFVEKPRSVLWDTNPMFEEWEEYKGEHFREWTVDLPKTEWTEKIFSEQEKFAVLHNQEIRQVSADRLRPGDIVIRSVMKGDLVMLNRQPSLHRHSINAMRVVPSEQHTISFNPAICVPYNADYDGDTMNIFAVSGHDARKELEEKMQLRDNLIHTRSGKLIVGTDHDQTSGIYLLTMKNKKKAGTYNNGIGFTNDGLVYFSKNRVAEMFTKAHSIDDSGRSITVEGIGEPSIKRKFYSGYDVISAIIPEGINAKFECGVKYNDDGTIVREPAEPNGFWSGKYLGEPVKDETVIINGRLVQGTLDRVFMGHHKASLAPAFYYLFGYKEGAKEMQKFLDLLCGVGFAAHHTVGYTMGTSDCGIDSRSYMMIDNMYEAAALDCEAIEIDFRNHDMQKYIEDGRFLKDQYTKNEKQRLLEIDPYELRKRLLLEVMERWEAGLVAYVSDVSGNHDPMEIAVRSGARGKEDNIQQMSGGYGQMLVGGDMLIRGYNKDRFLPHFPLRGKRLEHPAHYGFIRNCYYRGLSEFEYFFASMAGRRSLYESAGPPVTKSGYLARVIRKSLENLVVDDQRRLIDKRDDGIVSYLTGDDGYSPYNSRRVSAFPNGQILNSRGAYEGEPRDYTIELQPFFMEHTCKHGMSLEDECSQCSKGSRHVDYFHSQTESLNSSYMIGVISSVLERREVMKPIVTSMIERITYWHNENLVEIGEGYGATAGGNIAEPATQAALRAFHGGGKGTPVSVSGLGRLLRNETTQTAPERGSFIYFRLTSAYSNEKSANKIAQWVVPYSLNDVTDSAVVQDDGSILFTLAKDSIESRGMDPDFIFRQIRRSKLAELEWSYPTFIVRPIIRDSRDVYRNAFNIRTMLMSIQISGLSKSSTTYPVEEEDGWWIVIHSARGKLWDDIVLHLDGIADMNTLWSDSPITVESKLGLEAGLRCLEMQINYQMNSDDGIGEYDWRYIRSITDLMGRFGRIEGLGEGIIGLSAAINVFDGMAMGNIGNNILTGMMLNTDNDLTNVTSASMVGNTVPIGDNV